MKKLFASCLLLLVFTSPLMAQEQPQWMWTRNNTGINFNFAIDDTQYTAVPGGTGWAYHNWHGNFKLSFDNGQNFTHTYYIPPGTTVTFYEKQDGSYDASW